MFKKALSLLLSLMLIVTSLSVTIFSVSAADGSTYVVAGMSDLCGSNWDPVDTNNEMTLKDDGTYEIVYAEVPAQNSLQFKVVENKADGSQAWYGIDGGEDNITFHVIDTCDVTITFDPTTNTSTVSGDNVEIPTDLSIEKMVAVGNGDGNWLNGAGWDQVDEDGLNTMDEVEPGVYEITYTDIEEFDNYQVKFAANGSWADNWGSADETIPVESGVETDATYNGKNIIVDVTYAMADVTLRLDLTGFDYATKTGAKFTVTIKDTSGEEVSEPLSEPLSEPFQSTTAFEPTTVAEEETTAAPATGALNVTGTSNFFPESTVAFNEETNQVTVTYFMQCEKNLLNTQWELRYDPEVLEFNLASNYSYDEYGEPAGYNIMPVAGDAILNYPEEGRADALEPGLIKGNATKLRLYRLTNRVGFVSVTFDVIGSGDTTVDLYMDVLTVSLVDSSFQSNDAEEQNLVNHGVRNEENIASLDMSLETCIYEGPFNPGYVPEEPTTVPAQDDTTVPAQDDTTVPVQDDTTVPVQDDTTVPVQDDTTEAPTTVNNTLKVTATSNYFPEENATVVYSDGKTVTVTYYLQSEKDLLNGQWKLTYDPALLTPVNNQGSYMPNINAGDMAAETEAGTIEGSFSSLNLFDFSTSKAFVQITFLALGTGETVVDLNVTDLVVSEPTASGTSDETKEEILVQNSDVIEGATETVRDTVISEEVPEVPTTVPVQDDTTEPITTVPVQDDTTVPTEVPTTIPEVTIPEDTTAPVEPGTTAPVEPGTTAPVEPGTTAPVESDTTAPVVPGTTSPNATSATDATGVTTGGSSSSDTPAGGSSNSGAVQTGNASMALVILLVLVSASAALYFARKRVK